MMARIVNGKCENLPNVMVNVGIILLSRGSDVNCRILATALEFKGVNGEHFSYFYVKVESYSAFYYYSGPFRLKIYS